MIILEFDLSYYTHQGQRVNNEDYASFKPINNSLLAVVADGLGGHKNGAEASHLAVDSLIQTLSNESYEDEKLIYAIQKANFLVHSNEQCGLTTIAVLWLNDCQAFTAHVGDTRIYQFRNNKIIFQSSDHSVVQLGVSAGKITYEEARTHKDRNKLLRALGNSEHSTVECHSLSVQSGDRFLLCTDGFWEAITEEKMTSALRTSQDSKSWLSYLYRLVDQRNYQRQDNHTAIAIFVN